MPNNYGEHTDGKLHVRYSRLKDCTPYGVQKVVEYMRGQRGEIKTLAMELGSERHEQFAEESRQTGLLPAVFQNALPDHKGSMTHNLFAIKNDFDSIAIEEEIATEIFPGVILHSTPDFIGYREGKAIIVDYKCSSSNPRSFKKSVQHFVYAYQLMCRDILCPEFHYLVERWNKDKTEITGYEDVPIQLNRKQILDTHEWLWHRVSTLQVALEVME